MLTRRVLFVLLGLMSFLAQGQSISGIVFKDFNGNGTQQTSTTYTEPGQAGVRVLATNPAGAALTVAYTGSGTATNNTGSFTVTGGTVGQVRLEFILPDGATFASNGPIGGTPVLFPTTASVVLAVNTPDDFWDTAAIPDPAYVIPCYVQGPINGAYSADPALVAFKQSAASSTTTITNGSGTFPALNPLADKTVPYTVAELGTVWGVAFNKKSQTYYLSAFAKRHSGVGPQGFGAIYTVRRNANGTFANKAFFNLEGVTAAQGGTLNFGTITRSTSSTSLNYLAATSFTPSYDLDAYAKVGRISYGDIDFYEMGQKLFATNLFQQTLLEIDASTDLSTLNGASLGAKVKSYSLSSLSGIPACPTGQLRPWALKVYKDKGYLGLVCDASTSQNPTDLQGYVMSFNPDNVSAGLTPVLNLNLNYRDNEQVWKPWSTSFSQTGIALPSSTTSVMNVQHSEPTVSDIDFDENGNMLIALGNLAGHKLGFGNYLPVTDGRTNLLVPITHGDLLKACYNPATQTWAMENTVTGCGPNFTDARNTLQGYSSSPGSTTAPGEFFQDDSGDGNTEAVMGALGKVMGTFNVIAPMVDPFPGSSTAGQGYWSTGGMHWYNVNTGTWTQATKLYGDGWQQNYGKAFGLGDLEAALTNPPIQIGNRVWRDDNNNGVQDAGEPALAGVVVQLKGPGVPANTTAITNTNGEYYFSSGSGTSSTSAVYSLTGLTAGSSYSLCFPLSASAGALILSSRPNAATGTNADNIDSDANSAGIISFTLGQAGQNNFSFDVGYNAPGTIDLRFVTQLNCGSNTYTTTIQARSADAPSLLIGNSSILLTYDAASLSFVSYQSQNFNTGVWDEQISDGLSPGLANITLTLLQPTSSTPAITNSAWINVGTVTFAVLNNAGNPSLAFDQANTNFNSVPANDGVIAIQKGTFTGVSAAGSLSCVVCQPLMVVPAQLPNAQAAAPYSQTLTGQGGQTPYTFAVVGGTLPANLSLSSGGVFSGIPLTSGINSFTVRVTDARSCSSLVPLSLTIGTAPVCSLTVTATPGICQAPANTYTLSGSVLTANSSSVQTIMVGVNGVSTTVIVGPGVSSAQYSLSGLPATGTVQTVTVVSSVNACGIASRTFTAPSGCAPMLDITKQVDKSKAKIGDRLVYTIKVINLSSVANSQVVVQDVMSMGLAYVANSATASTGTFTASGTSGGTWTIPSLPGNATATLTYSASVLMDGVQYNVAMLGSKEAKVCTSIPIPVCKGVPFSIQLDAPTGYTRYQWYLTNTSGTTLVSDVTATSANAATVNSYTATRPGEYKIVVDEGVLGSCSDVSCCPIIIEETEVPFFTAQGKSPTCTANVPQATGEITLLGLGANPGQYTYQISAGSSFSAGTATASQAVPTNGVVATTLTVGTYTVRVTDALGCFRDVSVTLTSSCGCQPNLCMPMAIRKSKSRGRVIP